MNNKFKETLGYFLIIVVIAINLQLINVFTFNYIYKLPKYSEQIIRKNNDYLLYNFNELLDNKIKNLKLSLDDHQKKNLLYYNSTNQKLSDQPNLISNYLLKKLIKVIQLKELFEQESLTHYQISEITNLLFDIDNINIKKAIMEIQKLQNKKISTFTELNLSFKNSLNNLYSNHSNKLQKLLLGFITIINKKHKPWNHIYQINNLIANRNWNKALELATKNLSEIKELSEWRKNLENKMIIHKNITLIYESLCQMLQDLS